MKWVDNKYVSAALVLLILICLFFTFNYNEYLFFHPQSIHFWRQTDSLVFISGFFKSGNGLFSPTVLNQQCGSGGSASEFPLVYYIIAHISYLYEHKEVALRAIYMGVYFWGLYSLFQLYRHFRMSIWLSGIFVLLLSSSTIVAYYGCNYVPDIYSLGFILIGTYHYFIHRTNKSLLNKTVFITAFVLASISKAQFLLYPIALFCLDLSYWLTSKDKSFTNFFKAVFSPLLIPAIATFSWYAYVKYYNHVNCSTCFLTTIQPMWNLSSEEIRAVWKAITKTWYTSYYYPSTFHTLFLIIVISIICIKRVSEMVRRTLVFVLLGNIAYFFMFYFQFRDHDYYFLCFVPFIALLPIAFGDVYRSFLPNFHKVVQVLVPLALATIAVLSLNYGRKKIISRYAIVETGKETVKPEYYTLDSYLNEIGVSNEALVISGPDHTCNATLYFADRKGWTLAGENFTPDKINEFIDRGAEYIIIGEDTLKTKLEDTEYLMYPIGKAGDIEIFKLPKGNQSIAL